MELYFFWANLKFNGRGWVVNLHICSSGSTLFLQLALFTSRLEDKLFHNRTNLCIIMI